MAHDPPVDARLADAHWEYVDDYGKICWRPTARAAARAAADGQSAVREHLRAVGFDVHKEQHGPSLEMLGAWFDGDGRCVLPAPVKFQELVWALRFVVDEAAAGRPFCSRDIEGLLGKITWFSLLRREILSVLNEVYRWCLKWRKAGGHEEQRPLPVRVRQELEVWLQLCPTIRADLSMEWHTKAYMTDACASGFGVVTATVDEAAQVEEWERNLESFVGAIDHVAVRGQWTREASQVELEGVASVLALRHAVRTRACRDRRVLHGMDADAVRHALDKGRSSSAALGVVARRTAALCLFAGLRVSRVWVPSEWNLADGVSRGARHPCVMQTGPPRVDRVGPLSAFRPDAVWTGPAGDADAGPSAVGL